MATISFAPSTSESIPMPSAAKASKSRRVQFDGAQAPRRSALRGPSHRLDSFEGADAEARAQSRRHGCVPLRQWNTKHFCYAAVSLAAAVGIVTGAAVGTRRDSGSSGPGAFNDTFTSIDPNFWTVSNGTRNNGAYACGFTHDAVSSGANGLTLSVLPGSYVSRNYGCAQLISTQNFTYGTFSASIRPSPQPGVVSALFTYVETKPTVNQEIDLEFTGANSSLVWATTYNNAHVNTTTLPVNFNVSTEAHIYAIDWRDSYIAWSVDGVETYRATSNLPAAVPTKLFMSTWLRSPSTFGGEYDPNITLPTASSHFNWVAFNP